MSRNVSAPIILNTSATLAGFCFFVIASINALRLDDKSMVDNVTAFAMCVFVLSAMLSFLSIRSTTKRGVVYERIAEMVFMAGLLLIFLITLFITFNMI